MYSVNVRVYFLTSNILCIQKVHYINFLVKIPSLRPLSEGKVLKTKFDDIFAATRYDVHQGFPVHKGWFKPWIFQSFSFA